MNTNIEISKKKIPKDCEVYIFDIGECSFASSFTLMFFPLKNRKIYLDYLFRSINDNGVLTNISDYKKALRIKNTEINTEIGMKKKFIKKFLKTLGYVDSFFHYMLTLEEMFMKPNKYYDRFIKAFWDYYSFFIKKYGEKKENAYILRFFKNVTPRYTKNGYPLEMDYQLLAIHNMFNIPISIDIDGYYLNYLYMDDYKKSLSIEIKKYIVNYQDLPLVYILFLKHNKEYFVESFIIDNKYRFELQSLSLTSKEGTPCYHGITLFKCQDKWYINDILRERSLDVLPINSKTIKDWKGYKIEEEDCSYTFHIDTSPWTMLCYTVEKI